MSAVQSNVHSVRFCSSQVKKNRLRLPCLFLICLESAMPILIDVAYWCLTVQLLWGHAAAMKERSGYVDNNGEQTIHIKGQER